jgi:hypothetical protein
MRVAYSLVRFASLAVPLVALLATAPLGAVTPVVATPADETSPASNGADFAWTRGSRDGPVIVMKLGTVFVRHGDGRPVAITTPGVLAAAGGMDGRTLVVQVVRNHQSDLRLFDLRTDRFHEPPPAVNTRAWEWRGSISGHRLLFGRFDGVNTYEIVLANLSTGREQILESVRGHGAYAEPGQINRRYAVWAGCPDNFCTIYRYDVTTHRRVRVPGDYRHAAFAPSVAAGGDVFYGRGLVACGADVKLMRYRPGATPHVVASLLPGYDFRFSSTDGRRVLFDRVSCDHGDFDVYAVRVGS